LTFESILQNTCKIYSLLLTAGGPVYDKDLKNIFFADVKICIVCRYVLVPRERACH
jgi:hypothetical protein